MVAPLVGAWIEISALTGTPFPYLVAPLVGAWIEIFWFCSDFNSQKVAPLVGAWIEISKSVADTFSTTVAPLVGAWIEIYAYQKYLPFSTSLPSWERGLKFPIRQTKAVFHRRSPRGSVD